MEEDCAGQTSRKQKNVREGNVSFRCNINLFLKASQPEDVDWVDSREKDA